MLVNLKEILEIAEERGCAVGMFNATGFDSLQAVIRAAEELNEPVIIAHAEVHNVYNDISALVCFLRLFKQWNIAFKPLRTAFLVQRL